jgi:hypothetical protein
MFVKKVLDVLLLYFLEAPIQGGKRVVTASDALSNVIL